ncbi:MAG: ribonuclease P protein component [Spirochaetales bacterium]
MLEKKYRLQKRKEFGYIFKNGKSFVSKLVILTYLPTKLQSFKVGFSVSKKIGNAVTRNKAKRRLREAFKTYKENVNPKYNYILVARAGIENATYLEIVDAVKYCLTKTNLMTEETDDSKNS